MYIFPLVPNQAQAKLAGSTFQSRAPYNSIHCNCNLDRRHLENPWSRSHLPVPLIQAAITTEHLRKVLTLTITFPITTPNCSFIIWQGWIFATHIGVCRPKQGSNIMC